ncbi:endonuclease [Candidatus Palauibacter sp.]|uniref:endonuclease n=1 Tax=Candidatus Palauibacter sp. TaxID=3101350 RepID=UPI003B5B471B
MIEKVFFGHYAQGLTEFEFQREELEDAVAALGVARVKNLGDIAYSFRYRNPLPDSILETQPEGHEWIIEGAGKGRYRFKLVTMSSRILPREDLVVIDIPDATPELIRAYQLDDEQALLAMVRYNRLIDTFLGLTAYSLQNHLRTTVKDLGQIEIDELYIGIDKLGCHYVIPVQAKGEEAIARNQNQVPSVSARRSSQNACTGHMEGSGAGIKPIRAYRRRVDRGSRSSGSLSTYSRAVRSSRV